MMFATRPEGSLTSSYKICIYKPAPAAMNTLVAVVVGITETQATERAEAVLKALQELEK